MKPGEEKTNGAKDNIPKNAGKAPAFQFYAKDWIADPDLQSCSLEAHGLFINLLARMHLSSRPGYLLLGGDKPSIKALCRVYSCHHKTLMKCLKELLAAGVLKQDSEGVYYCSRMVRDNKLHEQHVEWGKQGYEKKITNEGLKPTLEVEVKPTLDLSSSSSSPSPSSSSSPVPSKKDVSEKSPSSLPGDRSGFRNEVQHKVERRKSERKLDPEALKKKFESDPKVRGLVDDAARELHVKDWSDRFYALIDLATKFPSAAFIGGITLLQDKRGSHAGEPLHNPFGFFVKYVTTGFREMKGS
jgi:hypothetical protein